MILLTNIPSNRMFYCDGDIVTCNGTGLIIQWTAPPSIPLSAPEGFPSNANPPLSDTYNDVTITLDQTNPFIVSRMILTNIPTVNVTCFTNIAGSSNTLELTRSGKFPLNLNEYYIMIVYLFTATPDSPSDISLSLLSNGTIVLSWTAQLFEGFDFSRFQINFCISNTCSIYNSTTTTLVVSDRKVSAGDEISTSVSIVSMCSNVESEQARAVFHIVPGPDRLLVGKLSVIYVYS